MQRNQAKVLRLDTDASSKKRSSSVGLSANKSIIILFLVLGCFAVLLPKVLLPMWTGNSNKVTAHSKVPLDSGNQVHPALLHPKLRKNLKDLKRHTMETSGKATGRPMQMQNVSTEEGTTTSYLMATYATILVTFFIYTTLKMLNNNETTSRADVAKVRYSDLQLDPNQHRFIFQEKYDSDGNQLDSALDRRRHANLNRHRNFELETLNVKMQQTEQQLEQLVRQFSELQQQLWCNDETTTTTAKECACCQSTQAHQFIGQTIENKLKEKVEATTKNEDDRKESTEPDVEIEGNAQIDQISTSEWIANCVHFNTNDDQENEDEEDEDDQQSDYESTEGRMRWKIEDAENEEDESKQDEESEKENVVEWLKVVTTASNKERGSRHQEANRQSEGDQTKEDPTIMKSVEESDKKEMTRMSSTNERRPLSSSQTSSEKDESTDTIEVKFDKKEQEKKEREGEEAEKEDERTTKKLNLKAANQVARKKRKNRNRKSGHQSSNDIEPNFS